MADLLTWEEVEKTLIAIAETPLWLAFAPAMNTIKALAQKLADSTCPSCLDEGFGLPCPHCGNFPEDRRGHFAIDAADALRRIAE
jgi:hypothetical protein